MLEKTIKLKTLIIWDVFFILVLYMVPTLSHLASVPLYKFEPMRCVLLANLLVTGNKKNAYFMSMTLPLFSFCVGGHPIYIKALLMTIELFTNVLLFDIISNRQKNYSVVIAISIILSKLLYYLLKYLSIVLGFLAGPLITTNLFVQFVVIVMIVFIYSRYSDKYCVK